MTLQEIRDRMAQLLTEARTALDEINDNTDDARVTELETRHDAIMVEHDQLEARAAREVRHATASAALEVAADPRRPAGENRATASDVPGEDDLPEYSDVFRRCMRWGVAGLTEPEQRMMMESRAAVPSNALSPEQRAQSVGADAGGGYIVPEGAMQPIYEALYAWGPMFNPGITEELVTTNGNRIPWPTDDDTGEGEQKAENVAAVDDGGDDLKWGEKQLDAYWQNTGIVRVPWELLEDSAFDIQAFIAKTFGKRMGKRANRLLTTGTGRDQPHGIVTASGQGITTAAVAAIAPDELIKMQHSVNPAYRQSPKCIWQFNDTTLSAIRRLKDGQGNYLWTGGDVKAGTPAQLLGKPYEINMAMADIGKGNRPVVFGDHSAYIVRKVKQIQTMTLRERYAEFFQVGMIGHTRFDGELLDAAAVKHLKNR